MEHQQINDNVVLNLCFQKNCSRLKRKFNYNSLPNDVKQYIENRYSDSLSWNETINRIYHKIDEHPVCPICGNLVKWGSCGDSKFFHKTCGNTKCLYEYQSNKMLKEHGYKNVFQRTDIKEKISKTFLDKYGVKHVLQNKEIKEKQQQTCMQKFGKSNIFATEQFKENFKKYTIDKYGVEHPMKSDIIKKKFDWKGMVEHQIDTKHKNNTFNTSKLEIQSYNILKEKYPDVKYQHKDKDRYPFVCDFYIPNLDLFIECNYHWTHGRKPFEGMKEDNVIINKWKSKNTRFYDNAIETWTIRDVNKRNTAKQNNLNYIEFWNIQELQEWINK